jgi:hypothetical protein
MPRDGGDVERGRGKLDNADVQVTTFARTCLKRSAQTKGSLEMSTSSETRSCDVVTVESYVCAPG